MNYPPWAQVQYPTTRRSHAAPAAVPCRLRLGAGQARPAILLGVMGSLIKKRRKRMRKKKHKKMLKATRWQRRAAGK